MTEVEDEDVESVTSALATSSASFAIPDVLPSFDVVALKAEIQFLFSTYLLF